MGKTRTLAIIQNLAGTIAIASGSLGILLSIYLQSASSLFLSLLILTLALGLHFGIRFYLDVERYKKSGRLIELVFVICIYLGVMYFIYSILMMLIKGK